MPKPEKKKAPPPTPLARLLAELRAERRWTLEELAEKTDTTHRAAGAWEEGAVPRRDTRRKIEKVYGLSDGALDAGEAYIKGVLDTVGRIRLALSFVEAAAREPDGSPQEGEGDNGTPEVPEGPDPEEAETIAEDEGEDREDREGE